MAGIVLEPPVLTIRTAPGESRKGHITIRDLPADPGLTVSVVSDDGALSVESVAVIEAVVRPMSEDEIMQLPPHPPSIRERARREGMLVHEETGRSDGTTPLPIGENATVFITVVLTVGRTSNVAGASVGALVSVNRTAQGPIEVPTIVLTGTPTAVATFIPPLISAAAEPGEVVGKMIEIRQAPAGGTVVALLAHADPVVRVKNLVTSGGVRREFTEDEIEQLPPHPPSIREDARRHGYIEYQERGRVAAGEPLAVQAGDLVQVFIEIAPPVQGAPAQANNRAIVESTGWQRIEVPIEVSIGRLVIELGSSAISVEQGRSTPLDVTLSSRAGPPTDVRLELGSVNDAFRVSPSVIHLRGGEVVRGQLAVTVDPNTYLGLHRTELVVRSFDVHERHLPIELTLLPGTVRLIVLDATLAALQGERAACRVQVIVSGGYKRLHFEPGRMPVGVRMIGRDDWVANGEASTILQLEFAVDRDARPADNLPLGVTWTANDGVHAGSFALRLKVILNPESRTFSQAIITPAGTPLGGRVDMTLNNDGSGSFRGHMRATGFFSYSFRIRSVIRSADGRIAVMAQKSGSVYGTDAVGEREFAWNDHAPSDMARDQWPDIRNASMVVNKSYELAGVIGSLADVVVDVAQFIGAAALLNPVVGGGATLAGMVLVGSELAQLSGVRVVGPGGLVGLVAAGGAAFLFGGGVILPVFVGGVVASDLSVKHRPLRDSEISFARQVFGDTLPFERVVVTNLSGESGQEFVAPTIDGSILVNLGLGFGDAVGHLDPRRGYVVPGQIFVHELTHVWQFTHGGILAEVLWRAALDKVGGRASYTYGPPGAPFSSFGLEAQASLIDEWFSGTDFRAAMAVPGRRRTQPFSGMQNNDPYFGYVNSNIRLAEA